MDSPGVTENDEEGSVVRGITELTVLDATRSAEEACTP